MLDGYTSSPVLRSLLQFEGARRNIPIRVQHTDLAWGLPAPRDAVEVLIHQGTRPIAFGIHLDGEDHRVCAGLWLPEEEVPMCGPVDADGVVQPVASVHGHQVALHLDPTALDGLAARVLGPTLEQAISHARTHLEEVVLGEQTQRYVGARLKEVEQRLESRRTEEQQAFVALRRAEDEVRNQYLRLERIKWDIDLLESYTRATWRRAATRDIERLRAMVPQAIQQVRVDDTRLLVTTNPISIEFDDYLYELGRFEFRIDIPARQLRVLGLDTSVQGYCHPHIHTTGECCLGNYGSIVADCLARQDHLGLVVAMVEFLGSYNPASPYIDLRRWDPNWVDEDRYESCYEDASVTDCTDCSDDNCPFWEDRFSRCWEGVDDYRACVQCSLCHYADDALSECRGQSSPPECVLCSVERCLYSGDEESCFNEHEGEACPNCYHENCSRHPGAEEGESEWSSMDID